MRVRILTTATMVSLINESTVPVRIDISDTGLPDQYPAFRWHVRALDRNPWIRRRFGHFALIDPFAQELLEISFGVNVERDLTHAIENYEPQPTKSVKLRSDPREYPRGPLPPHLQGSLLSEAFMTAYELSFDHWLEVVDVVAKNEKVVQGVKNAALHSYAEILNQPHRFNLMACRTMWQTVRQCAGHSPRPKPTPQQWLSDHLGHRAAIAMNRVAGLGFDEESPQLMTQVRDWWDAHQKEETYRFNWSHQPGEEYDFLRKAP